MNHQFNNRNYIDETEQLTLAWQAIAGEEPNSVYHQMSFLSKEKMDFMNDSMKNIIKSHMKSIFINNF